MIPILKDFLNPFKSINRQVNRQDTNRRKSLWLENNKENGLAIVDGNGIRYKTKKNYLNLENGTL